MAALGVTAPQINQTLVQFTNDEGGGRTQVGNRELTIRVLGSPRSIDALRSLRIPLAGGRYALLSDLADVGDGAAEQRGWALFKDEEKGNCAACHTAEPGADGKPPLFTDNSYDNLGVPRHTALRRPQQSVDHDLGLCKNTSLPKDVPIATLCGAFKVPSLRNVAVRKAFFHNAAITDLREVLAFYATRDTDPNRWYGKGQVFNDLPLKYQSNVNRSEVPYDRKPGEQPRLSEQDIDDVLAFLQTLTDADLADSVAKRRSATAAANAEVRADRLAASPRAANTP